MLARELISMVHTPSSLVREKERCRLCPELFLFLKGMTGALAPFSYLVAFNGEIS